MNITTIPKFLATKNSFSIALIISIYILFLVTNVKSDFSFDFPNFNLDTIKEGIAFANDATLKNGVIQLTRKDDYGYPLKHSAGQFGLITPIQIYDKTTGKVADFVTEFTFLVNTNGRSNYGDGFAFFIVSPNFKIPDKKKSEGGNLGIFTSETALYTKEVLLVEFDTFSNEWDPSPVTQFAHIGIDVNSIRSVVYTPWYSDFTLDGNVGKARIEYDSSDKKLKVLVTYFNKGPILNGESSLVYNIDLTTFLPEKVQIGFSASTGDLVETHDILSWSFKSNI
ncbi:lectin 11-like [Trifolium pratense]|uniref:lectin 11-like n=1 Tax=Trifolium pratense TaxID=57577 RepID=UPI0008432A3F|nr:lectin 11-like [Trifolium pratense]